MPEDIFEESTYKIKASLKEGGVMSKSYTGKLDLTYKKGDTELKKDSDIDVTKGEVKKDYPVPKVADTEENYTLKIIANYGKTKEKTRVLAEATVWPKKVKLTVKDSKDNSVCKNLAYSIVHTKGSATKGFTNDSGVGNEDLKKCPYSIKLKAPWETSTSKNDTKKREWEITAARNDQARFLRPDINQDFYTAATGTDKSSGVRQYVNAGTADDGCDGKSSTIEFEICCKHQPSGRKGDKIYIKVAFTKLSKRNDPLPALLAPAMDIKVTDGGKTFTGYTQLDANGGTAKFKLELGLAGGETFTVSCGYSKNDPSDDTLKFVTWRQVTYQLRYPTVMRARMTQKTRLDNTTYYDIPDAILNVAKTRLNDVFVEYTNIKSLEFTPALTAPCMVTKGYLADSADTTPVYVIDENLVWLGGAQGFDGVADNRESTITLCDAALDIDTKVLNPTISLTAVETTTEIDSDAEYKYFVKRPFQADMVNLSVGGYRWAADFTNVSATDQSKKPAITVTAETKDYDDWNDFVITEPDAGNGTLTINFPSDSDALATGDKANLKAYYEDCFNKPAAIQKNGDKLKFTLSGSSRDDGDTARRKAITDELNSIHSTSAKVRYHPGMDLTGTPLGGDMADVEITQLTSRKMKFKLKARASDTDALEAGDIVGAASATACPVNVTFSIVGAYTYNGHAGGGSQVLVLRDVIPESVASTVCHELGHAMGMAIMPTTGGDDMPVPPGLEAPKHVDSGGTYYRNKSGTPYDNGFRKRHQGPHCCDGMPGSKKSHQTFKSWSTGATDKVCIMWGEGGDTDDRSQYCAKCTEYLKARDLRDVRKTWAGSAEG